MPVAPGANATKYVAAADHHSDLHAHPPDLRDFRDDRLDCLAVDAVGVVPHERLAGEL